MEVPKRTTSSLGQSAFAVRAGCQSRPPRARKNPLKHERNFGLGMDALVTVCSGFRHGCGDYCLLLVWAWMHWLPYARGFGHGCTGYRMLLVWAWMHWLPSALGLGMDAVITVCSWFGHGCTGYRVLLVWAWMHWLPDALGLGMDALVTV